MNSVSSISVSMSPDRIEVAMSIAIQIKKLNQSALVPRYMTEHAAGMDLFACLEQTVALEPGERACIPTGIAMAIPPGYEGQVRARSGLAMRQGVALVNAPGTIDADYRGEIGVLLINLGSAKVEFSHGDRIAQLVIAPVVQAKLELCDELTDTSRGEGGFGHTGIRNSGAP